MLSLTVTMILNLTLNQTISLTVCRAQDATVSKWLCKGAGVKSEVPKSKSRNAI